MQGRRMVWLDLIKMASYNSWQVELFLIIVHRSSCRYSVVRWRLRGLGLRYIQHVSAQTRQVLFPNPTWATKRASIEVTTTGAVSKFKLWLFDGARLSPQGREPQPTYRWACARHGMPRRPFMIGPLMAARRPRQLGAKRRRSPEVLCWQPCRCPRGKPKMLCYPPTKPCINLV